MAVKPIITATLIATLPLAANADTLGFRIDAGMWNQEFDGDIQSGDESIDVQDTLGIDDESNNMYSVTLEHPIPVLPNIRLSYTELEVKQTTDIDVEFEFEGVTYFVDESVTTNADLSHTDLTLYYEILDNVFSLDFGINIRQFDEGVTIEGGGDKAELEIDGALPMLYAAVKFDLPLSGLYISADASGISYQDSSIIDYKVNLGYETGFGLGIEAGIRTFDIDYEDEDDSDEQADLTIDGAYASVFYHF